MNSLIINSGLFSSAQQQQLTLAVSSGVDVTPFLDPSYSSSEMNIIWVSVADGYDVECFINKKYNYGQLCGIRYALQKNVDPGLVTDKTYTHSQMNALVDAYLKGETAYKKLRKKLDKAPYLEFYDF